MALEIDPGDDRQFALVRAGRHRGALLETADTHSRAHCVVRVTGDKASLRLLAADGLPLEDYGSLTEANLKSCLQQAALINGDPSD